MADLGRLSLNTATLRDQYDLAACIEACARHGIPAISPWRDKLAEMGIEAAARHIRDAGLRVSGLCRGGMFASENWRDDNRRAIDEAASLGAACLVVLAGGLPSGSRDLPGARAQALERLDTILPYARAAGVALALEPLHPMTCADRCVLSTLAQALDWVDSLGDGVGVAVDAYHVWWDPAVEDSIARAAGRILAYHVCDWRMPTRDLVFDRGMMGDGAIDLLSIRAMVEAAGYAGDIEVEILSTEWWGKPAEEVIMTMKERFARCA